MRLLLDINVLLDVAFARPGESGSSQVIAACGHGHEAFVAWHTLANLSYLIERQYSAGEAREFVRGLLSWADLAPALRTHALQALQWRMADFEDALQAAAAVACSAQVIVTRNERDFKGSPVPALNPEAFLRKHATPAAAPKA